MNDLLVVENLQRDFCFYEIEEGPKEVRFPKTHTIPPRANGKSILIASYHNDLDTQNRLMRQNALSWEFVRSLFSKMTELKLIPIQYYFTRIEITGAKKTVTGMNIHGGRMYSAADLYRYKHLKIYRYTLKHSIISFLMQKEFKELDEDYRNILNKTISMFKAMDELNNPNSIKFDDAVEKLYRKNIGLLRGMNDGTE